jgi:hypothetical protein
MTELVAWTRRSVDATLAEIEATMRDPGRANLFWQPEDQEAARIVQRIINKIHGSR